MSHNRSLYRHQQEYFSQFYFSQTEREMDIGLNFAHFVLVGEFAGWSPAFLPLYFITNKYRDDIMKVQNFIFFCEIFFVKAVIVAYLYSLVQNSAINRHRPDINVPYL